MPRYQYTAIAGNGKKVKGTITAESSFAARKQLRVRNVHPSSVTEISSEVEEQRATFSLRGMSKAQLTDFTKQLATLLNSGIKLTEALSVLTLQTPSQRFKTALTEIRDRVVTGESFTDALKDYDKYFDVIYVAMVRVGEVTGTLGESLKTIANFMEKRQRVESKVLTVMIYPVVLVVFCLLAILILTTKVIPTIGKQIERAGQQLPWITQQMMNLSRVLTSWRVLIVIAGSS
jgi:general secretion pathway protein F